MSSGHVRLYQCSYIGHAHVIRIIESAAEKAVEEAKPCIVALPSVAIVHCLLEELQEKYAENVRLVSELPDCSEEPRSIVLLTTYSIAADPDLLSACCALYIPHGFLIASSEHIFSVNRLLTESEIANTTTNVYLCKIPSIKAEEGLLSDDFVSRYGAICEDVNYDVLLPCEVYLQCSLGNGIELLRGKLPFEKQLYLSSCPLTDAWLSIIWTNLKSKKRCIVVCSTDFEAKDIADRLANEFVEKLKGQDLPDSRTAMSCGIKIIGGVVLPTGNPFAKKYDGFTTTLNKFQPLLVVGSKRSILYAGYRAEVIVNVIFTEQSPMNFAEKAMLHLLAVDENSLIISVTDVIDKAFNVCKYSSKIFNKAVIHLVNAKRANTAEDIRLYFDKFFFNEVDSTKAIEDLVANGSLTESGGCFEIHTCKYLNGFFAIEKKKLLAEAYNSFDFKNVLLHFYLANLFFVESRDVAGVSKSAVHDLMLIPEVWKLSERIGLHDPKLTASYYSKMEASLIIASICYVHFNNQADLDVPALKDLQLFDGHDRMFDLLQMNHRGLTKTSEICQEIFGNIYANVFKQLAAMCLLFDTSPLQKIAGIDFFVVDSLVSAGVKTLGQLIHFTNLDRHVRFIANKRNTIAKNYAKDLRQRAVACELKSGDADTSGNNSRDLFNNSTVNEDAVFSSLCVLDEPRLTAEFTNIGPNEVVVMYLGDFDLMKIVRIDAKTRYYQARLRCCDDCLMDNRIDEVLEVCRKISYIVVSNALFISRALCRLAVKIDFLLKARCLSCLFYVVGQSSLDCFVKVDKKMEESWVLLHKCIVGNNPFTRDTVQLVTLSIVSELLDHKLVQTTKMAINTLLLVYVYGIPFDGFNSLKNQYLEKKESFPEDIQKAANSKFIPLEMHLEMADDVSLLFRSNNKAKKAKLVSTGAATGKQTSLFYTQLSQLRKLNQAIDLLNRDYFHYDSGKVFPEITFGGNGRLYTHAPNLQNFAKKLPFPELKSPRSIIRVEDSLELWSADYCEMELRMAAVLSRDANLLKALSSDNVFQVIAELLDLTEYSRAEVKLFFYGLLYGMGVGALEEYGFNKTNARVLWNKFTEVFLQLDEYRDFLRQKVISGEIVTDYFGKPVCVDPGSAFSAVNAVIQSSSAFVLLTAVGKISQECPVKVLFLVHDEVVLTAPKALHSEVAAIAKSWMETELDGIKFPIKTSYGQAWDSLLKY